MKQIELRTNIAEYQMEELPQNEQQLLQMAIDATKRSYAPYSKFHVGAAIEMANGQRIMGCNQENAAFPAGLCAERTAIFAVKLAIAARGTDGELTADPVSPCGTCRQVIIETETRFRTPVRILLYGRNKVYALEGIKQLMPLSFTEF